MNNFMPFFYLNDETGEYGLLYNLEPIYRSFIEMIGSICLFFIVSFLILHFAITALKWVEHIVCGGEDSEIFGGFDNE